MDFQQKLVLNLPKFIYGCCVLMFLMPIIPRGARPVVIGLLLIGAIISARVDKVKFKWGNFLLNSSLFIIYMVSLAYSNDLEYGLRKISTSSAILIFALVFSLMSKRCLKYILDRKYELMWLFIIATVVLCVGSFLKFMTQFSFNDTILHYVNIIRSDIYGWKIHPIYLSMHLGISIIFSLFLLKNGTSLIKTIALIILNLVMIVFLMIMIKKGPIIGLILVMAFLTLVFRNRKLYIISAVAAAAIIGTIIFNPKVQSRFSELLQVQNSVGEMTNSTNIRYSIYQCAAKILPEAGFFGYGIGDGKDELIKCYEQEANFLAVNRYNSHNQYLGVILYVGYLGLFLFSLFLLYHLLRAFSIKNYLLVAIMLFYCIVMFSENILERENGVLFFAFFINLFIASNWNMIHSKEVENSHDNINIT